MSVADVPEVLAVQEPGAVLSLGDVFPQDTHPFPADDIGQRWRQEIADPRKDCYVVLHQGTVVGFAAIRGDEFLHFGIAVEHWGTGLALTAHDEVLALMRGSGVRRAWLRVFTGNGRGRRFYEKLGWQPTSHITRTSFAPHPELMRYEHTI